MKNDSQSNIWDKVCPCGMLEKMPENCLVPYLGKNPNISATF